ncbi:tyrosine-type recombinase/integrase [Brevundimonas sp. DC300-4]|uniref:tyrosine-type recombinase/integrase n=1 Tax=Brevundimonas sp. DC300-4 TaxID=2804594 RepID=UPI003CF80AA5
MPAEKLNARKVDALKAPGRYGDGRNLYLQITPGGGKSWALLYTINGRSRQMGLGPLEFVSLSEARDAAIEARKLIRKGIDPLEAKRVGVASPAVLTFEQVAEQTLRSHEAKWTSTRSATQWKASMRDYVYPHIGSRPVDAIVTNDIYALLEPIWATKKETARRVRARIEQVLDAATALELRQGPNPARLRGNLKHLLPSDGKRVQKHHTALSYADLAGFMTNLRGRVGVAARALEFTILTAARTSETIGARWSEFDLEAGVWAIPAVRMKARRDHRVPLTPAALALLKALPQAPSHDFVFIGQSKTGGLSGGGMERVLDRMDVAVTVHGFRSTFRDWAAETTAYPGDVVEMALAHAVGNAVEAAYRRGDLFEKRRRLMEDWATYCAIAPKAKTGNVVTLRAGTDG